MSAHNEKRRTLVGVVTSNKMDKTVVVKVERRERHPVYAKFVRRSRKFYAHDEKNACGVGDRVELIETRPTSKLKRWAVKNILDRAE